MEATKPAFIQALQDGAPLIHHLNADTSWLLQIPRPASDRSTSQKIWLNIVIDPWLFGPQSDVASWFSTQHHVIPPRYNSIEAVEALLRQSEQDCAAYLGIAVSPAETLIDAIVISHEYTDHCHKQTLLEMRPSIPVFATTKAAQNIISWDHFDSVTETSSFGPKACDWTKFSAPGLPKWAAITRVVTEGDAQYYHSALLIVFKSSDDAASSAQGVIYTPHGIKPEDLELVSAAKPPIETLAFLHGLHSISLWSKQLNLGAHNGLKAQRILNSRYWIGTHDEVKKGTGFVAWFLRRKALTVQDAMREEQERQGQDEASGVHLDDIKFTDLENGKCAVLAWGTER